MKAKFYISVKYFNLVLVLISFIFGSILFVLSIYSFITMGPDRGVLFLFATALTFMIYFLISRGARELMSALKNDFYYVNYVVVNNEGTRLIEESEYVDQNMTTIKGVKDAIVEISRIERLRGRLPEGYKIVLKSWSLINGLD
jgi:hypothetical protein